MSDSSPIFSAINFKTNKSFRYFDLMTNKDYKHVVRFLQDLLLRKMSTFVNGVHITSAFLCFHLQEIIVSTNHEFK